MDLFCDATDPDAITALRREIGEYLRRHAEDPAEVDGAELVIAELLANVSRHAPGPSWISLAWPGALPTLTVSDLGPGFRLDEVAPVDLYAESGRGLLIVNSLGDELRAVERPHGGTEVSVQLAVRRQPEESFSPPPRSTSRMPELSEALPEGAFGRESFLRALVVELAQTVESQFGPDAAHSTVAQVGMNVGAQMEQEFRLAKGIAGRMMPAQLAECFVRLKHAIDGGFYVIDANEERIVLGNTHCPFGEVVQRAPALCRMTSSVFGGIAARNTIDGGASIVLEERIAVGDPGCIVVINLGSSPLEPGSVAHEYASERA